MTNPKVDGEVALGAEIMKEVTRYNDGNGCTRRQLVDAILILISQHTRLRADSAGPVVDHEQAYKDLLALRQQVEDTILVARTEQDAEGFITAYHFNTGAIHRLLAEVRK